MRGFVVTVLLVLTMDVTSAQISIRPIPKYPVINGSVTLSVTGIIGKLKRHTWYKGPVIDDKYEILKYSNSAKRQYFGPLYTDRIIAFDNGSLQINKLQITDGGNYIVRLQRVSKTLMLTVYDPVTKPKITASITRPKEIDPLNLTCNTKDAVMITWTRNGATISSGAKISGDNKTLTFSSVKRGDSGEYRCEAQNLVSTGTSDPYTVTVAYGPDEIQIEGTELVSLGSSITLTCSADSVPPPEYQWIRNGLELAEKTSNYSINNAGPKDGGQYTCVVRNPVTLHMATASVYVTVTAEFENYIFTLVLVFGLILGVLIILGSVCFYWKIVRKKRNELLESRQDLIGVYYNTEETQPTAASVYMGLQCRTEDIYADLQ